MRWSADGTAAWGADNNTTYSAGTALSLSSTTFNHASYGTAGTAGTSSATSGPTIAVPYVTFNAQGHETAYGTHTHTITNLETSNLVEPTIMKSATKTTLPLVSTLKGNKLALLPADQIIIEKTTDGGSTWTDAGVSDANKRALFLGTTSGTSISPPLVDSKKTINCGIRITITAMKYNVPSGTAETGKYAYWNSSYVKSTERYCSINGMYFWVSTNADGLSCKIEAATGANSNSWTTLINIDSNAALTGWSGGDFVRLNDGVFGGGTTQTGQYWNYRLTFFNRSSSGGTSLNANYLGSSPVIHRICAYGSNFWSVPNNLAGFDHLYSWDINQNATFPAQVTATKFIGPLQGNADTATNATKVNNHTVDKDVPSDAKFTDTVYTHPTTSGNKHIPSGGSSGQFLGWSADGTAA